MKLPGMAGLNLHWCYSSACYRLQCWIMYCGVS